MQHGMILGAHPHLWKVLKEFQEQGAVVVPLATWLVGFRFRRRALIVGGGTFGEDKEPVIVGLS